MANVLLSFGTTMKDMYTAANSFLEFLLQQLKKGKEDFDEDEGWEE